MSTIARREIRLNVQRSSHLPNILDVGAPESYKDGRGKLNCAQLTAALAMQARPSKPRRPLIHHAKRLLHRQSHSCNRALIK